MIYEYKCEECGYTTEKNFKMNEDHPKKVKCPKCNKLSSYRLFNSIATQIPYDFNSPDNRIKTEKKSNKKYF